MQQVRFIKDIDFDLLKSDGKTENAKFGFGEWFQVKKVEEGQFGYDVTFLNGDFLEACPPEVIELHNCTTIPYQTKQLKVEPPKGTVTVVDGTVAVKKVEKNDSDK